ncbi:MAG: cardiolipin synthase [Halopseudomonas yangmingensis]|uniref:Cardiolipin synthase n=1 Tax=Halopseudomonas yangmingensis TaxID=1720063 RepID=A0A1I4RR30_9GAMM|nr:cardiolipin synthase [Halopseudomonas yangmingensis]SFM54609.1 cardiolipin synthase [Halopseudomonas yangmingensis]
MEQVYSIAGLLFAVFYWLLTIAVTMRVIARRRPVSVTLAWLLVIFVLPVLGALLYLLIGELNLGRARAQRAAAMVDPYLDNLSSRFKGGRGPLPGGQLALGIHQLLANRVGIGAMQYDSLQLLDDPQRIFSRLCADVREAQHSIRIVTYIWHPGGRADALAQALIDASRRGIEVSLLIDHAGSRAFFRSHWRRDMVQAGIQVVPALPVRLWRVLFHRMDLRMHRKLVVIDDQLAWCGSMNIADPEVFRKGSRHAPWVDMLLRIQGPGATGLAKVFAWDWEVETGQRRLPEHYAENLPCNRWMSILPSGPGFADDLISQAVLSSIHRANDSIVICTPYFVPSEAIFDALCHAARRGVQVTLLLPRHNDSMMVGWASRSYFEPLLQAGGRIMLYPHGLLHTKAMLMDNQLALVGSVNLDIRSLQLNFELTVALFTPEGCAEIKRLLDGYREASQPLDLQRWSARGKPARALERLMYLLSPLL